MPSAKLRNSRVKNLSSNFKGKHKTRHPKTRLSIFADDTAFYCCGHRDKVQKYYDLNDKNKCA
jgi:hypothetical protein